MIRHAPLLMFFVALSMLIGCDEASESISELTDSTDNSSSNNADTDGAAHQPDGSTPGPGQAGSADAEGDTNEAQGENDAGDANEDPDARLETLFRQARESMRFERVADIARVYIDSELEPGEFVPPVYNLVSLDFDDWGSVEGAFGVLEIRGTNELIAIARVDQREQAVYLIGFDTSQILPGRSYPLDGDVLLCQGTITIENPPRGVARVVPKIYVISSDWDLMNPYANEYWSDGGARYEQRIAEREQRAEEERLLAEQEALAEQAALEEAKQHAIDTGEISPELAEDGFRTWTSQEGSFRQIAKMTRLSRGIVYLEDLHGESHEIAKDELTQEDQDAITAIIRAR